MVNKLDYNIEFAHIYTNEYFSEEHNKGISIFKKITKKLKNKKRNFVGVVLIDDYNPSEDLLNIENFVKILKSHGGKPDFIAFESQLVDLGDKFLKETSGKIRKEYARYIKKHNKYPCSFLVAIWYLVRLGLFPYPKKLIQRVGIKPKYFVAEKIINILPKRYMAVEKKAAEIIKSTKFKKHIKKIEYNFFNSVSLKKWI